MTAATLERPITAKGSCKEKGDMQMLIEEKLELFDTAVAENEFLEIDGDIEGDTPQEHYLKIINHKLESAFSISIDTIIRQDLKSIIKALETGVAINLYGVTRIVGYYSRVQNWNKSKIGELHDRHMGRYSVR